MVANLFLPLFMVFLLLAIFAPFAIAKWFANKRIAKSRAERLKWRGFALLVGALQRFDRRGPGDVIFEAVSIAATKRWTNRKEVPEELKELLQAKSPAGFNWRSDE
jgi:hypothetical protein